MPPRSLRDRIAQMFMPALYAARYAADAKYRDALRHLAERNIGGFIVFEGTREIANGVTRELQSLASTPLFFAADLEPGFTSRISDITAFPHAMAIGRTTTELCAQAAECIALEALSAGVNVNFAPVCDVNNNPKNPIINVRSFGETPERVADHAAAFIRGTQRAGVLAVAKHFPGHGDTAKDSHLETPRLAAPRHRYDAVEFPPFRRAIAAGAKGVMTAHILAEAFDRRYPATLSYPLVTGLLRREFKFNGLIFTDALEMRAITKRFSSSTASVRAVAAGCDILLMPGKLTAAINAVTATAASDKQFRFIVERALDRIACAKTELHSSYQSFKAMKAMKALKALKTSVNLKADHQALAVKIAMRAIQTTGILKNPGERENLAIVLIASERDTEEIEFAKRSIIKNLSQTPLNATLYINNANYSYSQFDNIYLFILNKVLSYSGKLFGFKEIEKYVRACVLCGAKNIVGVSLGNPYIWNGLLPFTATVNCFSDSRASVEAVAAKMFGETK